MTISAPPSDPLPMLRPTTSDAFAQAIATAASRGQQVQVTGSNSMPITGFDAGRPIQPISTLRCNKIIEHAVADMTVIVQAGITLDALQQQLAWKNQWLPIDPPAIAGRSPVQRTLGGLIASNSLGPLRYGCGDWRFLMLGMRWIDGNGTLIKGGGRTIKNVAGYNTPRLMIGSAGTLGAIAEVTLRTFARPEDEQSLVVFCSGPEQAETIISAVFTAAIEPAYVQAIGGDGFADNGLQLPASPIVLAIGFLGRPEVCGAQIELLRGLPQLRGVECIQQNIAQAGRLRLWMTSEPAGAVHFRIHALSSQATALIAAIQTAAQSVQADCRLVAEMGQGIIRGELISSDFPAVTRCWQSLQELCAGCAGMPELVLLYAAPQASLAYSLAARELYNRIKAGLDPQRTFGDLR